MEEERRAALIEALAAQAHTSWSGWMRYLFSKGITNDDLSVTIPPDSVRRWTRQMGLIYDQLPERERESDRTEALAYLEIMERFADVLVEGAMQRAVSRASSAMIPVLADHPFQESFPPRGEAEATGRSVNRCCNLPPEAHPPGVAP
jgi:hypothetical protein